MTLITLSTGHQGLRRTLATQATVDPKDPDLLTMVASDDTLDRYSERIEASGWDLASYQKNPVIQNSHRYDDIIHTIGRADRTWVSDGKLMQVWRFASAINPMAKLARDLYAGGFLHASSVGFIPIESEPGNQQSGWARRHIRQELLEVSAVSIPANPNALAEAYDQGAVDKSTLQAIAKMLRHGVLDEPISPPAADPVTTTAGSRTRAHEIQRENAELLRQLHALLH